MSPLRLLQDSDHIFDDGRVLDHPRVINALVRGHVHRKPHIPLVPPPPAHRQTDFRYRPVSVRGGHCGVFREVRRSGRSPVPDRVTLKFSVKVSGLSV